MELCEICNSNPATIHLTQIDEGEMHEHRYCAECAEELGLSGALQPLSEELGVQESEKEEEPSCSKCGTTLSQFEEEHVAGCAHCYITFAEVIENVQQLYTGHQIYRGKQYRPSGSKAFRSELDYLKQELSDAVKQQKFELASVLRDRIRELEYQADRSW